MPTSKNDTNFNCIYCSSGSNHPIPLHTRDCPECGADGRSNCKTCKGAGYIRLEEPDILCTVCNKINHS